jgi:hypothetical protein
MAERQDGKGSDWSGPTDVTSADLETQRRLEDAGFGRQELVGREQARSGFMARENERHDHPGLELPDPEEVLGEICQICHGTTWVVRANAELDATPGAPIMAQLEPCDNPNCAQIIKLGLRPIQHLALPANSFDLVVVRPNSSIIMALTKG